MHPAQSGIYRVTSSLMVWCFSLISATPLFAEELQPPEKPIHEAIDFYVQAKLHAEKVSPAEQAADNVLLRRLTLDLAGRIPTISELNSYTGSTDPEKRIKAIDRLLASPDYAFHQRNELDLLLMEKQNDGGWRDYLLKACQENRPWPFL